MPEKVQAKIMKSFWLFFLLWTSLFIISEAYPVIPKSSLGKFCYDFIISKLSEIIWLTQSLIKYFH